MLYYVAFILYIIGTNAYFLLLKLLSPFNARASKFTKGREKIFDLIESELIAETRQSIWFHVASLGEYEQAKPVIERLKQELPQYCIVITFFSPSGYENRKDNKLADYTFYLPYDSAKNAKRVVSLFKPVMAVWVKYDFWFYFLNQLKKQHIPIYLIAANYNKAHLYFKWYAGFFRKMLNQFHIVFTQNQNTEILLKKIGIERVITTGDPRFDRVYQSVQQLETLSLIEQFKEDNLLIVIGSSYDIEEKYLAKYLAKYKHDKVKYIVAPHFIDEKRLLEIESTFGKMLRYSRANSTNITKYNGLLIDNIGMLSKIYRYADIVIIGGGFKPKGLHNILEAATFGKPIIYGDQIKYFPEALLFNKVNASIMVSNEFEFCNELNSLVINKPKRLQIGLNAESVVLDNLGATEKILSEITKPSLNLIFK